jgi:hypothetical protein
MAWFSRVKACSHPNKTNKQYIQATNVGVDFVNEPCVPVSKIFQNQRTTQFWFFLIKKSE